MYIENEQQYNKVPKWVLSLLQLGYVWDRERSPWKRKIGLVSLPCKSTAAPLAALGAMIRDLERENANNIDGHFDALCRARDSNLENTDIKKNDIVIDKQGKKYKFSGCVGDTKIIATPANYRDKIKKKGRLITNPNGPCKSFITIDNAKDWRLEGSPVIETRESNTVLNKKNYQLINKFGSSIQSKNLQRSYTGLLLIGDGQGRTTGYMESIYSVCFNVGENLVSLGDLLTLHPQQNGVRRIAFCNKQKIDCQGFEHYLVITDGASAFVKALSHFKNSDVLGVYSRDEPSGNLMDIANILGELGRYYSTEKDCLIPINFPHGITAHFMRGR